MRLRVAIVQINSLMGEIEANKKQVMSLLNQIPKSKEIDLVVLPELALTGYNFESASQIKPYLDDGKTNTQSTDFARQVLEKFKCFTVLGMPQLVNNKIYNSCKLINPLGTEVYTYHKTFLYEVDEVWGSNENHNRDFEPVDVILNKEFYLSKQQDKTYETTRINFGICMDLNPYQFKAPFNAFEFAMSCYNNKSNLIICPMAWLSPYSPSLDKHLSLAERTQKGYQLNERYFSTAREQVNLTDEDNQPFQELSSFVPQMPDYSTINYHILRFFPFLNHVNNDLIKRGTVTVLTCNRIGVESDVVYGGSSSIFQFKDVPGNKEFNYLNPSVSLKGFLSQGTNGILYRELDI